MPHLSDDIRFLKAFFERVPEGAIAIDKSRKIVLWNDYATTIFGWTQADALGRTLGFLFGSTIDEEGHDKLIDSFWGSTRSEQGVDMGRDVPGVRKNGSKVIVNVKVFEVRKLGEDENESYLAAIIRDVTESVNLRIEVQETNRTLEIVNRDLQRSERKLKGKLDNIVNENVKLLEANLMASQAESTANTQRIMVKGLMTILFVGVFAPIVMSPFGRVPENILNNSQNILLVVVGTIGAMATSLFSNSLGQKGQDGLREFNQNITNRLPGPPSAAKGKGKVENGGAGQDD